MNSVSARLNEASQIGSAWIGTPLLRSGPIVPRTNSDSEIEPVISEPSRRPPSVENRMRNRTLCPGHAAHTDNRVANRYHERLHFAPFAGSILPWDAASGPVTRPFHVNTSTVKKSMPASTAMCVRMKSFHVVVRLLLGAGGIPWRRRTLPTV